MTRRRRRETLAAPESLAAVLGRAGEQQVARSRFPIAPHVWAQAVGLRIAERARPVALDRGVLTVRAATSVWASELSLLAPEILARLRAAGVPVRELRFHVGAIEPVSRPPEVRPPTKVPVPVPLPPELAEAARAVEDPDLRAAIEAAARAKLALDAHLAPRPTAAPRAARAPRAAETGSAPPGRTTGASREAAPGTRGGGRDRSR